MLSGCYSVGDGRCVVWWVCCGSVEGKVRICTYIRGPVLVTKGFIASHARFVICCIGLLDHRSVWSPAVFLVVVGYRIMFAAGQKSGTGRRARRPGIGRLLEDGLIMCTSCLYGGPGVSP